MFDNTIFEVCAHYTRGMATMSFLTWAIILYRWRKRNQMTFLLFVAISYVALGYIKDTIFLLPPSLFSNPTFVEDLVSLFDIAFAPLVCGFFLETTRPGLITRRRLVISYLLFIAFIPLYCIVPANWVVESAFVFSALLSVATLVLVPLNAVHYSRYLSENYSYTKGISVKWCVVCTFCFFIWLLFYEVCFYRPTWFGEMLYDGLSIVIWNVVCLLTRNHRVVVGIRDYQSSEYSLEQHPQEAAPTASVADFKAEKLGGNVEKNKEDKALAEAEERPGDSILAAALRHSMETDKVYLNPHLSLSDLAVAVGSNKTYISIHINRQGKTFYDFINEYRVAEACRIIDTTPIGQRPSMPDVAERSGFNSISSFNRYFAKIKGITPAAYARQRGTQE